MKFGGIVATDKMKQEEDLRSGKKSYFYDDEDDDAISTLTDHETFEKGVKLGAGMAVGFTVISIGFGLAAGIIGLAYQKATGE